MAVAHDDDLVANIKDLLQAVRDEDDRDAARRHAADGIEQRRSLLFRQNGGRLVENKQLEMLLAQLARDLGELLMADRHIADDHVGVDVDAHFFNGCRCTAVHLLIIERVQTAAEHLGDDVFLLGLTVEQNILRRRKAGDQRKLLMHHADTGCQCVKGGVEGDLFTVDENISAVPAGLTDDVHAEEDLHQRALARTVFADKAEHLALAERKADIREDLIAEEILFDAAHLQQRSVVIFHKLYPT